MHPYDLAHTTGVGAVSALGVSLVALVGGLAVLSSNEQTSGPTFSESVVVESPAVTTVDSTIDGTVD
ncbi:hypothetical protein ELQ94_03090 [Labedella endophytica]|uniref:DUF2613 family protein n=2 Tax=Labedella endophytica TaxID=1523160 RepID=A0A3S0XDP6_9MICO|nr:hypothetical protein ELQ94_03090 [Labedella endophytica]